MMQPEDMLAELRPKRFFGRGKVIWDLHVLLKQYGDPANIPIAKVLEMYANQLAGCTRVVALVLPREWIKEDENAGDGAWSKFPLGHFYSLNTKVGILSADRKSLLVGEPKYAPDSFVASARVEGVE